MSVYIGKVGTFEDARADEQQTLKMAEQRREVADNIRCAFATDDCKCKEQFFDILVEQIMPYDERGGFEDVAERIADLIDRAELVIEID